MIAGASPCQLPENIPGFPLVTALPHFNFTSPAPGLGEVFGWRDHDPFTLLDQQTPCIVVMIGPGNSVAFPSHPVPAKYRPLTIAMGTGKMSRTDQVKRHGISLFIERSEEHTSELQSREKLVCRL